MMIRKSIGIQHQLWKMGVVGWFLSYLFLSYYHHDKGVGPSSSPSSFLSLLSSLGLGGWQMVEAWVVLARASTQIALYALTDRSQKTFTLGILFRTDHKDITLQGAADTDCYIAVGDSQGFDRLVLESPQLCIQLSEFPLPDGNGGGGDNMSSSDNSTTTTTQNASRTSLIPNYAITGMDGNQGIVAGLNFDVSSGNLGDYSGALSLEQPFYLPFQTFPLGLSTDASGHVYLGLQDTGGVLPPAIPESTSDQGDVAGYTNLLQDTQKYVNILDHALGTEHFDSPRVIKVDMVERTTVWEMSLITVHGKSTVGTVLQYPSQTSLVVLGSTTGSGDTVGGNVTAAASSTGNNNWDGYITFLDSDTGLLKQPSFRFQSQGNQDDYILGGCILEDNLYVLGSTTGSLPGITTNNTDAATAAGGGGFVMKLSLETLDILWAHQFLGENVQATLCEALSDHIIVAGQVPPGVVLKEDPTKTYTSTTQDIFLSVLNIKDGTVRWVRQIDSRKDDQIANFASMDTGDITVTGNAMNFVKGISDIYVISMQLSTGFYDWELLPENADPIHGNINQDYEPSSSSSNAQKDKHKKTVIVVATIVPLVVLSMVVFCALRVRKTSSEDRTKEGTGEREQQPSQPEGEPSTTQPTIGDRGNEVTSDQEATFV